MYDYNYVAELLCRSSMLHSNTLARVLLLLLQRLTTHTHTSSPLSCAVGYAEPQRETVGCAKESAGDGAAGNTVLILEGEDLGGSTAC